ncbi:EAL domain-containing protein [Aromatoleum anaerobium]|uniref:EAL domain-containing protein n=1 Tax=Aromatoleum anaerobium TaxID=182180 RepID=A0ABX1PMJ1_9RHOO|nr:EAL domain-containing protein [Aromatoleum anaerobium]MCK0507022.1 EAL domain-containing protein [Aromatoleum anaerobium]
MTLRRTFFTLLGAFAVLSATAGLWQLADSRQKAAAAEWIELTARMGDAAQRASAQLAMERGLTAVMLPRSGQADEMLKVELRQRRAAVDESHAQLAALADELARRAPDHPVAAVLAQVRQDRAEIERRRAQLDVQLQGAAGAPAAAERWVALTTGAIENLEGLITIGMLPLRDNIYTYASLPVTKDLLFTLAEHVGRERAVLGVAIAQGAPLGERDQVLLGNYRVVATHARRRVEVILEHLPASPELSRAREVFEQDLLQRYEAVRAGVYRSGIEGLAYPLSGEEWYREASRGIDAVIGVSEAVGAQFARDIERLRRNARHTLGLVVLTVVVLSALFGFAVRTLWRRVLEPLKTLDDAARRISGGDLAQPLAGGRDDEFGHLARTFEQMRQALLDDIARREADARELRKLNTVVERSASAVAVTDGQGIIQYTNPRFRAVTGYTNSEALGRKAGFWRSGLNSPAQYRDMWETILKGQVWEGELINRRKDGSLYWAAVHVSPVVDDSGALTNFVAVQHDISEHRQLKNRLAFLASYDELTELPNQNLLRERFAQAAAQAHNDGSWIALVSLGLGRFKQINDSLGRKAGDDLLRIIARRLSQCIREQDAVSRQEGTEFILMLTGLGQAREVQALLERIIDIVRTPAVVKGEKLQPSAAAGVSLLSDDGDTFEALLHKATIALHHAEAQGLKYCVFSEELDRETRERMSMESALRLSLAANALELHYQPKVDLATGRVVAVEALARWRHPVSGEYISPARFIPIAEESGLIQQLGAWALGEACRQNKAWQDAGLPVIIVAVNLSAAQLHQPDLVEIVADVLARSELDPALLELELTESALMEDPRQANLTLTRLKQLGLQLAIDDFGTGYSSLTYLSEFPIDQLKIDRSFVMDLLVKPAAAAISSSVIALAHRMGLKVVAEGVETAEQLTFLERHHCDEMQGYYFSKPLPADELAALLRSGRRLASPAHASGRTVLVVDDENCEMKAPPHVLPHAAASSPHVMQDPA